LQNFHPKKKKKHHKLVETWHHNLVEALNDYKIELEKRYQVEDGSVKFICMFPLAARVTGDCDEEQSVIQPSRTLKKYIQLWWQN
jgi:hypothetical protein